MVKDRVCLRALEKIIHQLADSKDRAELLSATALQSVDANADGRNVFCDHFAKKKKVILFFSPSEVATDDLSKSAKKPKQGNTFFILFLV